AGPEPASPAGEPAIAETAPPPAAEPVDVAEPQAVVEVAAVVEETPQATEIAAAPVASEDAPPAAEDPARPPTEAATVAETVAETVVETAAAEPPVEAPVEAPAEVSAEVPAETVADVPTEQPVEAPAAVAAEVPTEHPAEAPAVAGPPAGEPAAPEVQLAEAQPNHAAAPVALPVPQPRGDELRAVASGGAAPPTLATADRATLPDLPGLPHLAQAAPGELAAEPLDALPATPVEEVALEHAGDGLDIPPAVPPQALVEPPAPPERPMPDRAVTFAFAHPVRAAVFQRGDGLWLVFQSDTPGLLDPAALMAQATDGLGEALTAAAEGGVAVRVSIAHGEQGQARLDGSQWTIGVAAAPQPPAHPIAVDADAGSASGGRVLIAVPGAPSPVRFIDPVIGDRLIVVTVDDAGAAVATERGFARFSLPTTAAGAVIVPRTEALGVVAVPEGVAISSRDGLELSRPEDALAGDTAGASGHDRLLDLAGWRGDPGEFLDNRGALQRRVAQTDGVEQDRTRLELARFLFANGQETEALGILGLVADSNAWLIDDDAANRAMRGAALALDGEGEAALVDLTAPDLDNSAEGRLWQGVVAARHHDWEAAAPAFANAEEILDGYPDWLLARLAPLGIEAFLETGDVSSANALLEALSARPIAHDLDPLGEYWAGRIAAARNDPITARSSWEAAAAGPDRLYRRRAEMALLDLAREGGEVTPDEEVERLEELRYAWRGDDLEFDVLDQLGDAYWRAGRLRDAITVWQQAIDAFPELAETVQLGERVPERLNELFSPDRIETLPPFHILALYREYQDILADLPEWRDIRLRMADRLAAVDLLDEAAELLVGVMTELEPGAERARIGARSAALRLLDRDPQAALNTLDASLAGAQDDAALAYERRLLRARALSELDETDAALVLLEGDNRPLTLATRLDIARRARDWPLAAATLAQMADPPPEEGAALSTDQARLVLNRAVALALAGDRGGLDALAETYGPSLEGTPLESTFAMIVRPGGTPRMSDLDAIRSEVEEIDLFQNFLSTYREGNPGAAARSPTMN
ncbi:MAG: hypothetical protein KDA49_14605, partial [Rhodospirillaceae bacterium]|nr:hypothetical protein [Rhodospirillaceae bacterium]